MAVLFVCGIHGVGKTTFCQKLSEALGIPTFSSSCLIKESAKDAIPAPGQGKSVKDVSGNQQILITEVQNKLSELPQFILDGHTTIIDSNGAWHPIGADVFAAIGTTALIMLAVPPEVIHERILKRDGKAPPLDVLARHQEAEQAQAKNIAIKLGIPLFFMDGEDLALLPEIQRLLAQSGESMSEDAIVVRKFSEVDLTDCFFDSLKESYKEFADWFARKSDETAYVSYDSNKKLQAFLYLKKEDGPVNDIEPPLNTTCLKVGTFKIIAHGTKLGERFVKIIVDATLSLGLRVAYVTVFKQHEGLIRILETYGFIKKGTKKTPNGEEDVYIKDMQYISGNDNLDYPVVNSKNRQKWLMSIYAEFHTELFPDSKLKTERTLVIQDFCHTNSIHKVYVGAYWDFSKFKPGDCVVIYRCVEPDSQKPAWFGSVATSLCIVEEVSPAHSFKSSNDFVEYCQKYSVFDEAKLRGLYMKKGIYAVRMSYNLAFPKRPTLGTLVENEVVPHPLSKPKPYMGLRLLDDEKFRKIMELGEVREGFVIY